MNQIHPSLMGLVQVVGARVVGVVCTSVVNLKGTSMIPTDIKNSSLAKGFNIQVY